MTTKVYYSDSDSTIKVFSVRTESPKDSFIFKYLEQANYICGTQDYTESNNFSIPNIKLSGVITVFQLGKDLDKRFSLYIYFDCNSAQIVSTYITSTVSNKLHLYEFVEGLILNNLVSHSMLNRSYKDTQYQILIPLNYMNDPVLWNLSLKSSLKANFQPYIWNDRRMPLAIVKLHSFISTKKTASMSFRYPFTIKTILEIVETYNKYILKKLGKMTDTNIDYDYAIKRIPEVDWGNYMCNIVKQVKDD